MIGPSLRLLEKSVDLVRQLGKHQGRRTPFLRIGETDCVAGHIGYEL
jgi:hypothetical protein